MKYSFCPICGGALIEKYSYDEGGIPYCISCDIMFFDTPKPCVVVAVVKNDKILLLKQSYIFKNSMVLISGYVINGEDAEKTAIREVKEETGIDISEVKYLGSYNLKEKELLMLSFMGKYIGGEISKSDEVEWVGWIDIKNSIERMSEDQIGISIVRKVIKEMNLSMNGEKLW